MRSGKTPKTDKSKSDAGGMNSKKLILPLTLEDGRVPGLLAKLSYAACALIAAAVIWAYQTEIRELAIGRGEIVPLESVKIVHHLEGGIIEEVLGEEGQLVDAGQVLVRLRDNAASSELEQLQIRKASLNLRKMRLTALLRGDSFNLDKELELHRQLAEDQLALYESEKSLAIHEERTLQARIDQRIADLDALDKEALSIKRQVEIETNRLKSKEALFEKQLLPRSALQDAKSEQERLIAEQIVLVGKRNAAKRAVEEARSLYLESKVKVQKKFTEELAKITAELAELDHAIAKQIDFVDRLNVRSPTRGIVQYLPFRSNGEVVKPGALVAKVVPSDDLVVAEVRLDPKDIGHVKIGDAAEIKISAFDPNVFGFVPGTVQKLSASTFQSETGEVYYKATIALSRDTVGTNVATYKITPGMVVQADIVTGAKSLVRYMLKPVYSSLDTAFTER